MIGGVIAAQSILDTVKTIKVISTANQIQIMVNQFVEKTRYLPGDAGANAGIPVNAQGNQDGLVTSYENRATLSHLVLHNLYPSSLPISFYLSNCRPAPTDVSIDCWIKGYHDVNNPNSSGTKFRITNATPYTDGTPRPFPGVSRTPAPNSMNVGDLFISYGSGDLISNTSQNVGGALTGLEAAAIDTKVDDGIATTGSVLGHPGVSNSCAWPGCDCIDDNNFRDENVQDGDSYLLNPPHKDCVVLFKIGHGNNVTGNPF